MRQHSWSDNVSCEKANSNYPVNRRNGHLHNHIDLSGAISTDFGLSSSSNEAVNGSQDDRMSSGVYSASPGSRSTELDANGGLGTPRSSGNGYDFKTLVDSYLMQSQQRYGMAVEDEMDEGLDDVYQDLSSPLLNRSSQNLTTINELGGHIRPRTASAGSMGLRYESSHNHQDPVDMNQSPALCANHNRFSFDESLLRQLEAGGDSGMMSPLVGVPPPLIWCMECSNHMVVVGCSNGRIELWDPSSGFLLGSYEDNPIGATGLCIAGSNLVIARLNGTLEFLELVTHHSVHINQALFNDHLAGGNRGMFNGLIQFISFFNSFFNLTDREITYM